MERAPVQSGFFREVPNFLHKQYLKWPPDGPLQQNGESCRGTFLFLEKRYEKLNNL